MFSPDGARIAYRDNSQSLWVTELATGKNIKIASEPVYSPLNLMSADWSPDSRWLAYTVQASGLIQTVNVWSAESGRSIQVTDGLSEMLEPVFDPNGEFLYVLASTDAGPLKDWFSQINIDAPVRYGLYAITLRQDGPSAAPPQSDEVDLGALAKAAPESEDKKKDAAKDAKGKGASKASGRAHRCCRHRGSHRRVAGGRRRASTLARGRERRDLFHRRSRARRHRKRSASPAN